MNWENRKTDRSTGINFPICQTKPSLQIFRVRTADAHPEDEVGGAGIADGRFQARKVGAPARNGEVGTSPASNTTPHRRQEDTMGDREHDLATTAGGAAGGRSMLG